jgi:hypothetical protein
MYKNLVTVIGVSFILGACSGGWGPKPTILTSDVWNDRYHDKKIAESDFMLEVIRFTDARRPRQWAPDVGQDVIYEYNPDELLSGVNYRFPVLLEKHFGITQAQRLVYLVEVELKELRTAIRTGGIRSGQWGEYDVKLEADVLVRRPDSSILMQETYDVRLDRTRRSKIGRSPAADLDKQRMFDLTEAAIRKVAQQTAWKVRGLHRDDIRMRVLEERARESKEFQIP